MSKGDEQPLGYLEAKISMMAISQAVRRTRTVTKEMGWAILAGVLNPLKEPAAVKARTNAKMLLSEVTYSVGYCFILVGTMFYAKNEMVNPHVHHNLPGLVSVILATFSIVSLWTLFILWRDIRRIAYYGIVLNARIRLGFSKNYSILDFSVQGK